MKKIIGLCGVARSGKDTFFNISQKLLLNKTKSVKHSFAHVLKKELDELFIEQLGFSSFTEDPIQKELIRSTLSAWGQLRRTQNPLYWIEKVQDHFINGVNFITDVRFKNEVDFIKRCNGRVLYIHRLKDNDVIAPANDLECKHTLPLQSVADHCITWDTVGSDTYLLETQVESALNKLLY